MRSVSIQAVDGHRLVPVSRRLRFTASGRIDVQCSAVQFRFMSHIIGRAMRVRYPSSKAPAYNADEGYSVFTVVCLEGA